MQVAAPHESTKLQPDHVYVLAPSGEVTISDGVLHLLASTGKEGFPMPIDRFLSALAVDQKHHAVGVILSGSNEDGAQGLRSIRGEGGIAIVQDPDTARFPLMPQTSIAAGVADLIMPTAEIAAELTWIGREFARPSVRFFDTAELTQADEQQFELLYTMLRLASGIDFSRYRPSTLQQRIVRRMMLKRLPDIEEYTTYVQSHPDEATSLQDDLFVSVTTFFRDAEVFDLLKKEIFPRLFSSPSFAGQIRIWVAGCSTGAEVYSIAICLLEHLAEIGRHSPTIQIFGTDSSEGSIQKARTGVYAQSIENEVSPERLTRFFRKHDKGYQVTQQVRDLCIFARHNLHSDPPFSRIDLVSCRNVLPCFSEHLQRQIVGMFRYSLKDDGYLLLGDSDAIGACSDGFYPFDRRYKFYARTPSAVREAAPRTSGTTTSKESGLEEAVSRSLLTRFAPAAVVVDDRLRILLTRGNTAPYLDVAPEEHRAQLSSLVRQTLAVPIQNAVRQSLSEDTIVRVDNLQTHYNGQPVGLSVEVSPIPASTGDRRYFLIVFLKDLLSKADDQTVLSDGTNGNAYIQALIEERDLRNQELVHANEETRFRNEQLQTIGEELQTIQEEAQCTKQELNSVNGELQQRNAALSQSSNDIKNLLASVNLPVLILNNEMQIREFTPPMQNLLSVRRSDIGRPLRDLRYQIKVDDLEAVVQEVLDTLNATEMEVQDSRGCWYLLRVRPYRTSDNRIEGAVLLLVDIDHSRRSLMALRAARDFAHIVVESLQIPVVVLNKRLQIRSVNSFFRALVGEATFDLEGRSFPDLVSAKWGMSQMLPQLKQLQQLGPSNSFQFQHEVEGADELIFSVTGSYSQADGEGILLIVFEVITLRVQAERLLTSERNQLQGQIKLTERELCRTQQELGIIAGKMFTTQEEERSRIARELHDDIIQKLALIEIELHKLALSSQDGELKKTMDQLRKQTSVLSEDVRQISHKLHPSILDDLGLAFALRSLLQEFGDREGMPVTFVQRNVSPDIPNEIKSTLYRIAQEALRNIAKHAGKTHARVTIEQTVSGVRLEIADSGEGFDTDHAGGGLGLISMVERARLIHGVVSLESVLGKGTTVSVEVPLANAAATALLL